MSLSPKQQVERFRELIKKRKRENDELEGKSDSCDSQGSSTPSAAAQSMQIAPVTNSDAEDGEILEDTENSYIMETMEGENDGSPPFLPNYDSIEQGDSKVSPDYERNKRIFITPTASSDDLTGRFAGAKHLPEKTEAVNKNETLERERVIRVARPKQRLPKSKLRREPPNKRSWAKRDGKRLQSSRHCRCAVRGSCPRKPKDRLDCRTLAPFPKSPGGERKYEMDDPVVYEKIPPRKLSDINNFSQYQNRLENCPPENVEDSVIRFGHWIDNMRFFAMTKALRDASKIIQKIDTFLSSSYTFKERVSPELRDDLTMLTRRWRWDDFDPDIHRGIVHRWKTGKEGKLLSKTLDRKYAHRKTYNHYGMGDLVNGQCWLNQIELLRDGAHGCTEGGIDGPKDEGARSVILSCPERRDDYADRDQGDVIYYMGTSRPRRINEKGDHVDLGDHEGHTRHVTDATAAMLTSVKSEKPIRVIRSWRLPMCNRRRTHNGFRFDGLYRAVGFKRVDDDRALYRFKLVRLPGQTRIRYELPNTKQLDEFARRRMQEESVRKGA